MEENLSNSRVINLKPCNPQNLATSGQLVLNPVIENLTTQNKLLILCMCLHSPVVYVFYAVVFDNSMHAIFAGICYRSMSTPCKPFLYLQKHHVFKRLKAIKKNIFKINSPPYFEMSPRSIAAVSSK